MNRREVGVGCLGLPDRLFADCCAEQHDVDYPPSLVSHFPHVRSLGVSLNSNRQQNGISIGLGADLVQPWATMGGR